MRQSPSTPPPNALYLGICHGVSCLPSVLHLHRSAFPLCSHPGRVLSVRRSPIRPSTQDASASIPLSNVALYLVLVLVPLQPPRPHTLRSRDRYRVHSTVRGASMGSWSPSRRRSISSPARREAAIKALLCHFEAEPAEVEVYLDHIVCCVSFHYLRSSRTHCSPRLQPP
jgi:hypothetical protein